MAIATSLAFCLRGFPSLPSNVLMGTHTRVDANRGSTRVALVKARYYLALAALLACRGEPFQEATGGSSQTANGGGSPNGGAEPSGGGGANAGGGSTLNLEFVGSTGVPVAGAYVLASGADGESRYLADTDGQGKASVEVVAGGWLTVAVEDPRVAISVMVIEGVTEVRLVDPSGKVGRNASGDQLTVLGNCADCDPSGTTYVGSSCTFVDNVPYIGVNIEGQFNAYRGCPGESSFSVVAFSLTQAGKLEYYEESGQLALGTTSLDLGYFTPAEEVANVGLLPTQPLADNATFFTFLKRDNLYRGFWSSNFAGPFEVPAAWLPGSTVEYSYSDTLGSVFSFEPVEALTSFNPGAVGRPGQPSFDTSTKTISFDVGQPKGDMVQLVIDDGRLHYMLAPPTLSEVTLPTLPAEFSAWSIDSGDVNVEHVDALDVEGYPARLAVGPVAAEVRARHYPVP